MELSKLAEKDPEFYKYLQENDQELLDFNLDDAAPREEDEEEDEGARDEDESMESMEGDTFEEENPKTNGVL